jgi:ribosome maturation factor RimP
MGRGHQVPYFIDKNLITKEHILGLANQHLEGSPVYVTGIRLSADNHIQLFIDGDEGVTITDCVALSRAIEGQLNRDSQDFALDVSSHGATSPLLIPRQYKRHIGRTFQIKLNDGTKAEGDLLSFDDEEIKLEYSTRENKPVGKGKVTVMKQITIRHQDIKESKIKLKY